MMKDQDKIRLGAAIMAAVMTVSISQPATQALDKALAEKTAVVGEPADTYQPAQPDAELPENEPNAEAGEDGSSTTTEISAAGEIEEPIYNDETPTAEAATGVLNREALNAAVPKKTATKITFSKTVPDDTSNLPNAGTKDNPVYVVQNGNEYTLCAAGGVKFPEDSSYMFDGYAALQDIVLDNAVDASAVTTLSYFFRGCTSLTRLDASNLNIDTENVTSIGLFAYGCSSLETVDLSHLDFTKVRVLTSAFEGCGALKSYVLPDCSAATSIPSLFKNCASLTSADLSALNNATVLSADGVFEGCSSLTSVNLGTMKFNSRYVSRFFYKCSSLKKVDISAMASAGTLMETAGLYISSMFAYCSNLTELDLTPIPGDKVKAAQNVWNGSNSLETITVPDNLKSGYMEWYPSTTEKLHTIKVMKSGTNELVKTVTLPAGKAITNIDSGGLACPEESVIEKAGGGSATVLSGYAYVTAIGNTQIAMPRMNSVILLETEDENSFEYMGADKDKNLTEAFISGVSSEECVYSDERGAVTVPTKATISVKDESKATLDVSVSNSATVDIDLTTGAITPEAGGMSVAKRKTDNKIIVTTADENGKIAITTVTPPAGQDTVLDKDEGKLTVPAGSTVITEVDGQRSEYTASTELVLDTKSATMASGSISDVRKVTDTATGVVTVTCKINGKEIVTKVTPKDALNANYITVDSTGKITIPTTACVEDHVKAVSIKSGKLFVTPGENGFTYTTSSNTYLMRISTVSEETGEKLVIADTTADTNKITIVPERPEDAKDIRLSPASTILAPAGSTVTTSYKNWNLTVIGGTVSLDQFGYLTRYSGCEGFIAGVNVAYAGYMVNGYLGEKEGTYATIYSGGSTSAEVTETYKKITVDKDAATVKIPEYSRIEWVYRSSNSDFTNQARVISGTATYAPVAGTVTADNNSVVAFKDLKTGETSFVRKDAEGAETTTVVTPPEGSNVSADYDGTITVPAGTTIKDASGTERTITGGTAKVTPGTAGADSTITSVKGAKVIEKKPSTDESGKTTVSVVEKDLNGEETGKKFDVVLPDGKTSDDIKVNPDGTVTVPDGSKIVEKDAESNIKSETTISGGTATATPGIPGSADAGTTVKPDAEGTVVRKENPNADAPETKTDVTITVKNGDSDTTTTITVPKGDEGKVKVDENGTITVPGGAKIEQKDAETGDKSETTVIGGATVDKTGTVTPDNGGATVKKDTATGNVTIDEKDNEGKESSTVITPPSGGSIDIKTDDDGNVTVDAPAGSTVKKDGEETGTKLDKKETYTPGASASVTISNLDYLAKIEGFEHEVKGNVITITSTPSACKVGYLKDGKYETITPNEGTKTYTVPAGVKDVVIALSGDADGNGEITMDDALEILKYSLGEDSRLSDDDKALWIAEVGNDADITMDDALEVLKYSLGESSILDLN